MGNIAPETPLTEVSGTHTRFLPKLKRLGVETVRDLLYHFPARYEDFSQIYKIADLIPKQEATVQGEVAEITGRRTWRRYGFVVEALISDDSGSIRAVWFNQPYIRNSLQPGRLASFAGKVSESKDGELYLSNPTYELITDNQRLATDDLPPTLHTGRIVPVYSETRGLTSKGIRYLIKPLLDEVRAEEPIPDAVLRREKFPEINAALRSVHFPDDIADALTARKRFAFEDLFFLHLRNLQERRRLAKEHAHVIAEDVPHVRKLVAELPFALTLSQKAALWEILRSIAKPHPMNRLLQGDVGSGKTVVAAIAALETSRAGYQTAFMAPTELLARQHYRTFTALFPEFEGGVALLTGSEARAFYGNGLQTEMKKTELQKAIAGGRVAITIGTHALLVKAVSFPRLALVVVDEQHRFGVKQRAALLKNSPSEGDGQDSLRKTSRSPSGHGSEQSEGSEGESQRRFSRRENRPRVFRGNPAHFLPHFLSMSATPIPRTLSLTVFGDLDLSLITELPKDRKPIITKAVAPEHRAKAYQFIREQVRKGRQVFVICPRIEPTLITADNELINADTYPHKSASLLETKAVTEEYEKLSKKIFPDLKIAMLHGRMKSDEKERVMRAFADGATDVLVSTSVVEVGVDVPNASIMMIESAERFGLAQLYQFRGRVGRGAHQSFCFLFTEATGKAAQQRLQSIVEAKNGFELAEQDLKMLGPGEFLGETQSGMPDLAMQAIQNPELVKRARDAAVEILERDPALKEHTELRARLAAFEKQIHRE
ncbi:MAG: ATP-dependent DNA helicase RecG [Candidatus Jorgensenbacteria bacterium]